MKYPIFDLTPEDFEQLTLELFQTLDDYDNLELTSVLGDFYYCDIKGDLSGIDGGRGKVAIEVKHWLKFNVHNFRKDLTSRLNKPTEYNSLHFVTSAKIENHQRDIINDIIGAESSLDIKIFDQAYIVSLLDKHPLIAKKYFSSIRTEQQRQRKWIIASTIGVITSIIFSIFSTNIIGKYIEPVNQPTLDARIEKVEGALANLRNLESYLGDVKEEMVETRKTVQIIEADYERAQKLKKLTDEELAFLSNAINTTQWYEKPLNYFFGFILGIGSSVIGSILRERYKKRKILQP